MKTQRKIEYRSEDANKLKNALADYFVEHEEVEELKFVYPNGVTVEVIKYE